MEVVVCENYEELSRLSCQEIVSYLNSNKGCLVCFAGGDTPVDTLKYLVEAHHDGQVNLNDYYYIELDEWVGLDRYNSGSCADYLIRNLFVPAGVSNDHLHFFDAKDLNLERQCKLANYYIEEFSQIGLVLLGVGINGHVGFNEPNQPLLATSHVVNLSPETQQVGQKYFAGHKTPQYGITISIPQLIQADKIMIQVCGKAKKEVITQLLNSKQPSASLPISYFKECAHAKLFIDTMIAE